MEYKTESAKIMDPFSKVPDATVICNQVALLS